jgi:NosR/NirI family nitrous oxide reductase transcriptional regulator
VNIRADVDRALRWLPVGLLFVVLAATLLLLPTDPAHLEPFDAYVIGSAGWATIMIAVVSLVASLFTPIPYCHYGCPTGALLNFIRSRGVQDEFGRREIAALILVVSAWLLSRCHPQIHAWMVAG